MALTLTPSEYYACLRRDFAAFIEVGRGRVEMAEGPLGERRKILPQAGIIVRRGQCQGHGWFLPRVPDG